MKICVFGASGRELDRDYYEAAEELGALIAEHGHTLVFGGSRNGLMGAAAHGAAVCGGKVIGVMPREYDLPDVTFQGCTELIYTDTVAERKRIMQEQSDGFIILPGGLGTLDEFFDTLAQRQLDKLCKPIALLNTLDYFAEKGVTFVSLKENIDTTGATGKLIVSVLGAISAYEREINAERREYGYKKALDEKRVGRPKAVANQAFHDAVKLWKDGKITATEAIKQAGMTRTTFYKLVKPERGQA